MKPDVTKYLGQGWAVTPSQKASFQRTVKRAKAAIRKGGLIVARRQTGCTTALMQVIAEDHDGRAVLISVCKLRLNLLREMYANAYPGRQMPILRRTWPADAKLPIYVECMSATDLIHSPYKAAILQLDDEIPLTVIERKK